MIRVVCRDVFAGKAYVVDPALMGCQQNKISCKRNCQAWCQAMYDATEFMNEQLFAQPGDGVVVLGRCMQCVRVVACSPEPTEDCIDFGPAPLEQTNVQVDQPLGFGV